MYIRQTREQQGLSQKRLAELLGVSQPTVSDWESGRKNPTLDNLTKIAELLGCSVDSLVFGPGAESPSVADIKFALFGQRDIDDELYDEVMRFAQYVKQKKYGQP